MEVKYKIVGKIKYISNSNATDLVFIRLNIYQLGKLTYYISKIVWSKKGLKNVVLVITQTKYLKLSKLRKKSTNAIMKYKG